MLRRHPPQLIVADIERVRNFALNLQPPGLRRQLGHVEVIADVELLVGCQEAIKRRERELQVVGMPLADDLARWDGSSMRRVGHHFRPRTSQLHSERRRQAAGRRRPAADHGGPGPGSRHLESVCATSSSPQWRTAWRALFDDGRVVLAARLQIAEVSAQCLERVTLFIDLARRPETQAAKERHRRAPALESVLKQKTSYGGRQDVEPTIDECPQPEPDQSDCGGVGLQRPLDVPLPVELLQPVVNRLGPGGSVAGEGLSRVAADLLVVVHRRMRGHAGNGQRKHGGSPVCGEVTQSAVTAEAALGPIHATCVPHRRFAHGLEPLWR